MIGAVSARFTNIWVLLLISAMIPGCSVVPQITGSTKSALAGVMSTFSFGGDKEKAEKGDDAQKPKRETSEQTVVGTIRFNYEGFVLIYTPTKANVAPGTIVTVLGKDGKPQDVEMKISAERKESFLVADIIRGDPKAGQLVITSATPSTSSGGSSDDYQILD